MAAITFNTAHPKGQVREQLDVVLAAFRRMLDSFVSYQMRQAAAEAQHACPRQTPVSPTKNEVNAMQLTSTDFSSRQPTERSTPAVLQDGERSGILPPDRPATVAAQFRPLDPGVVSETIPAFFIGRNKQGFGSPVTSTDGSAEYSCSKTPRCRLPEAIAGLRAAQAYTCPSGSNSTWKTGATRLWFSLDRARAWRRIFNGEWPP